MNTPIYDFVKGYAESGKTRLHMPGHKGVGALGIEAFDITEVGGADVLYHDEGIIKESRMNAGELFMTKDTFYSTEGSSLCIRAMLYLISLYARSKNEFPLVLAGRNAHKSFISALALTDTEVRWVYPADASVISCTITEEDVRRAYSECTCKPTALYVTSPDYLGCTSDIKELSAVCRELGMLLVVDNAHGGYLKFLPEDLHPITLGADMCCDSAHKTLPALTGAAYLHIGCGAPDFLSDNAPDALMTFASTSPSYLTLISLDRLNAYLNDGYRELLADFTARLDLTKKRLIEHGYTLIGDEPLKITIAAKKYGYTGEEMANILSENGMEVEFSDPDYMTLMLTPELEGSLDLIEGVLMKIPPQKPSDVGAPRAIKSERVLSLREALFAPSEKISAERAIGRVLGSTRLACPPAIPILMPGERISSAAVELMRYYGITECKVVK